MPRKKQSFDQRQLRNSIEIMSRYFDKDIRSGNDRRNASPRRIDLPEFIPLNDSYEKSQNNSRPIPQQFKPCRIDQDHSPARHRNPSSHTSESRSFKHSFRRTKENGRGASPREQRLSPPQDPNRDRPQISPIVYNRNLRQRSRSRSPIQEFIREDPQRSIEREHYLRRSPPPDRQSLEQNRHGSVFARMSSPPVQRRRFRESSNSRWSGDSSNHGSNGPQLFRQINGQEIFENAFPVHQRVDPRLLHDDQNIFEENSRRIVVELDGTRTVGATRPLLLPEEVAVINSLNDRLEAAMNHCRGLETTVRSYEREIHKLRTIVYALRDEFQVVTNCLR